MEEIGKWEAEMRRSNRIKPEYRRFSFNHVLAKIAERCLVSRLEKMGYRVNTTVHTAPFDLWANEARIEVKAARWHDSNGRGRYQANIRNDESDLLMIGLKNNGWNWLIIPTADVDATTITIRSKDVKTYSGKYAKYLNA